MQLPELGQVLQNNQYIKITNWRKVEALLTHGGSNKGVEASKASNKVTPRSWSSTHPSSRRLLGAEINQRRELGLCSKSEEKFRPNQKCKAKQLQLLIMEGESEDEIDKKDFHKQRSRELQTIKPSR